jgi:hypothetical protein
MLFFYLSISRGAVQYTGALFASIFVQHSLFRIWSTPNRKETSTRHFPDQAPCINGQGKYHIYLTLLLYSKLHVMSTALIFQRFFKLEPLLRQHQHAVICADEPHGVIDLQVLLFYPAGWNMHSMAVSMKQLIALWQLLQAISSQEQDVILLNAADHPVRI